MTRGVRGREPQARPTATVVTVTRKVDSSGNVSFVGALANPGGPTPQDQRRLNQPDLSTRYRSHPRAVSSVADYSDRHAEMRRGCSKRSVVVNFGEAQIGGEMSSGRQRFE